VIPEQLGPAGSRPAVDAWRDLVAAISEAGEVIAGIDGLIPPIDVLEGFRYVLHVLGNQVDRWTARESAHPRFSPAATAGSRKLFFDNPDTDYETVAVSSRRRYRIRGRRGTEAYLAFCVYSGDPLTTGSTRKVNLSDAEIAFDDDGSFEIICSRDRPPLDASDTRPGGNWLPLDPDAHVLFARRYHFDRAVDESASYEISALDEDRITSPLDEVRFTRAAQSTARFVTFATTLAHRRALAGARRPNEFFHAGGEGPYGTPDASYVVCWYTLADDEMLVVEVVPPACRYWGVHLANRWGQSIDGSSGPTVLNTRTARYEPGTPCRIVVAHFDPGERNWLDTSGHPEGWVLFRWLIADDTVVPSARVVPHAHRQSTRGRA
jgi:hypothetical protein